MASGVVRNRSSGGRVGGDALPGSPGFPDTGARLAESYKLRAFPGSASAFLMKPYDSGAASGHWLIRADVQVQLFLDTGDAIGAIGSGAPWRLLESVSAASWSDPAHLLPSCLFHSPVSYPSKPATADFGGVETGSLPSRAWW